MACSHETYEAAKTVLKLTEGIKTSFLDPSDPEVATQYMNAVNALLVTIFNDEDLAAIVKELYPAQES